MIVFQSINQSTVYLVQYCVSFFSILYIVRESVNPANNNGYYFVSRFYHVSIFFPYFFCFFTCQFSICNLCHANCKNVISLPTTSATSVYLVL